MIVDVLLDRKLKELPSNALGKPFQRPGKNLLQDLWQVVFRFFRVQKTGIKPDCFFDVFAAALALIVCITVIDKPLTLRRDPECKFSFPFTIFLYSPRVFRWNPSVSLETAGFFHSATPSGCFSLLLERPRKSPKLPARRADVTAAGRARPRGFVLLSRRFLAAAFKISRFFPF